MGVYEPVLIAAILVGVFTYIVYGCTYTIRLKYWFLLFATFIIWLSLKLYTDLELYYVKQYLLGTTGGVILFYITGLSASLLMSNHHYSNIKYAYYFYIFIYLLSLLIMFNYFLDMKRPDLFYIDRYQNDYQRPGNFLSILFIIYSFITYKYATYRSEIPHRFLGVLLSYLVLSISTFILGQLFGSNSVAAVVLMCSLITSVFLVITSNTNSKVYQFNSYNQNKIILICVLYSLILLLMVYIIFVNFYDHNLRVFGFSAESNSSISSRFKLLADNAFDQISYAPFIGDYNVAKKVSGSEGKFLHSFFPFIWANTGLVGLIISIFTFFMLFYSLARSSRNVYSRDRVYSSYSLYIILSLLFIANLSTDVSWPVIWFGIGMLGNPVSFSTYGVALDEK
jgi:hypothetical protein